MKKKCKCLLISFFLHLQDNFFCFVLFLFFFILDSWQLPSKARKKCEMITVQMTKTAGCKLFPSNSMSHYFRQKRNYMRFRANRFQPITRLFIFIITKWIFWNKWRTFCYFELHTQCDTRSLLFPCLLVSFFFLFFFFLLGVYPEVCSSSLTFPHNSVLVGNILFIKLTISYCNLWCASANSKSRNEVNRSFRCLKG